MFDGLNPHLRKLLDTAPTAPGVYVFKDVEAKPLYVGKAAILRPRVRSYFQAGDDGRYTMPFLIELIADIEFVITTTEQEALILENNLVKTLKPRFNIKLRDDKTFISIRMNVTHDWPRLTVMRRPPKDRERYFGPFASATAIRQTMKALEPVFPLRLCSDHTLNNRARPCIYYDIGRCCAPCVGKVTKEQYREIVEQYSDFLSGRDETVTRRFKERMEQAAEKLEFEEAARWRDKLQSLQKVVEAQRAHSHDFANRDVFGVYRTGEDLQIHVLHYRDGKLLSSASHRFRSPMPDAVVLEQFLSQFYSREREYPREVLLPLPLDNERMIEAFVAERAGNAVDLLVPQRGDRAKMVEMASTNARYAYQDLVDTAAREEALVTSLQQALELSKPPVRIECFDISTFQGTQTVGSQVTFVNTRPERKQYKRYKVSPENEGDDFSAMREVLSRRVRRSMPSSTGVSPVPPSQLDPKAPARSIDGGHGRDARATADADPLPDLIILDGGVPQLQQVMQVLEELGVIELDIVALAKSRQKGRRGARVKTPERVYKPGVEEPIVLPEDSSELYLVQRIRDEAHRFAITYHRKLRQQHAMVTGLEAIKGLGPKRRHLLLAHFGSGAAVRRASLEELSRVSGLPPNLAQTVYDHFQQQRDEQVDAAEPSSEIEPIEPAADTASDTASNTASDTASDEPIDADADAR